MVFMLGLPTGGKNRDQSIMKTHIKNTFIALAILLTFHFQSSTAHAQGTAFTYQGHFNDGGSAATGSYDLSFTLFDAVTGGNVIGSLTNTATSVSNGLFTATLDFGGVFTGTNYWLEIAAQTNGGAGFTTLSPRQQVTPTPYAIYSANAGNAVTAITANSATNAIYSVNAGSAVTALSANSATTAGSANSVSATNISGVIALAQLPGAVVTNNESGVTLTGGTFTGNGSGLTALNAANLTGSVPSASLTSIPAASLTGTVNNSSLSSSVALVSGGTDSLPFVSGTSVGTDIDPISMTTADVNGDGKMDLISLNSTFHTLTVATNNGSGGFATEQTVSSGGSNPSPQNVVAADMNGDGYVDLITANQGANSLSVLTNNGAGVFTLWQIINVVSGANPSYVVAADVNGDGKMDLICANRSLNSVSVLLNNGSGGFSVSQTISVGSSPRGLVAADLNGDGKIDLATANFSGNSLTVLLNNGSGSFTASQTIGTGNGPQSVTALDINDDGKMDLVSANSGPNTLSVFVNNGSGSFSLSQTVANVAGGGVEPEPYFVTAADLNGDGRADLYCVNANNNFNQGTVSVFTNGPAGFVSAQVIGVGGYPLGGALADVNGDHRLDLICVNSGNNTLGVYFGTGGSQAFVGANTFSNVGNVFAGNGSGLTALNASAITNGTLSLAQLPAAVVTNTETGVTLGGTFNGNGSGLTVLNAAVVTNTETGVTLTGTFNGNGNGLTNLNATNLTGTVPLAQTPLPVLIQTNFIDGRLYTNTYGWPLTVNASVIWNTASVAGYANESFCIQASPATGGVTNASAISTIVGSSVLHYTNSISGFVPTNAIYFFTNLSTGAGNSAAVKGGQIKYP
jgi:hypothetical protein